MLLSSTNTCWATGWTQARPQEQAFLPHWPRGPRPMSTYLVHLIQTLVSQLQSLHHLHFNLGELDTLDLGWTNETAWSGPTTPTARIRGRCSGPRAVLCPPSSHPAPLPSPLLGPDKRPGGNLARPTAQERLWSARWQEQTWARTPGMLWKPAMTAGTPRAPSRPCLPSAPSSPAPRPRSCKSQGLAAPKAGRFPSDSPVPSGVAHSSARS